MTDPALAPRLLESAQRYAEAGKWWSHLFLLMPDHVHALLVFPELDRLSDTVGQWKRFHAKLNGIRWQSSFFDHRLRHDESFEEKVAYIRRNPVVKGLCAHEDDWPWVLIGEH